MSPAPVLPSPRGPLGRLVLPNLTGGSPLPVAEVRSLLEHPPPELADPLASDDLQVVLWCLHRLSAEGYADVDPAVGTDPGTVAVRSLLDDRVEQELRRRTADRVAQALAADGTVPERLFALVEADDGASTASYLRKTGTADQLVELLAHRSAYNLRESDPQAAVVPYLPAAAQTALVELLHDEYGGGDPERHHGRLFARAMAACGLTTGYGDHVPRLPGPTLAVATTMFVLAGSARLAPAAMGHFGVFEATSSGPSRLLCRAVERLGLPREVHDYYDEHVEADAIHEQLAFRGICGAIAEADPDTVPELFFGAAACLLVEDLAGRALLDAWEAGRSALLEPTDDQGVLDSDLGDEVAV